MYFLRMTDKWAQMVHDIVCMHHGGALGFTSLLSGVRSEGSDKSGNKDVDFWVVQKSYRYISNTRLSTIYFKTGCINMIRHARRKIVAYSCNKLN